ncbi:MAG TPA: immunoglobulin domain-containing protein [Lacunisphaera sp.]|nr:immunoglobulin domain-containing protein [Lacunisphaera sp.]
MASPHTPPASPPRAGSLQRNEPSWRLLLTAAALLAALLAPAASAAPTITKFPASQTVAAGASVTFSVEASGTAPLSYQWYRGATAIAGATSDAYTISSAQLSDAGLYAIAVTDATGTTRTFSAFGSVFAGGIYHSLMTKADGTLWAAGYNGNGQLGDGTTSSHYIPVQIATGVAQVAAGDNHSLFIKTDGTLWAMGNNGKGQLGDGTTVVRLTPFQVATGVAAAAAGSNHSLFLKTDGTLWAMGDNLYGQLGDGTGTARSTPVQIATGVQAIAARSSQSFFIKTDGSLWATGLNSNGQLGDGTTNNRFAPVQVATGVASVAAGGAHTLFIKTDGTLWAMGYNGNGQLGDGSYVSRVLPVQVATNAQSAAAGTNHSLFVKTDGTLWGMGSNGYGQLGDGSSYSRGTAAQLATGVQAVSTGMDFTFYLKTDGTLWATGYNGSGQLGDGSGSSYRFAPFAEVLPGDTPAILNVGVAPTLTTQTASQAVTAGASVSLSVTATGAATISYQWYKDGAAVPGATGANYFISPAALNRMGSYTVTATNTYGSITSAPIVLTLSLPVYPQVAVPGKAVAIPAITGGSGTVTWQISTDGGTTWTNLTNDGTYLGADTTILRIPNVTRQMATHQFRYQVTSGSDVVTSNPIGLTVFTSPLELPTALMVDRTTGKIYVTDAAAQTLLAIAPDLKLSVVAGKVGEVGTTDGPATSARFHEPSGFVLDPSGSIYLADTSNSSIREINSSGVVSTLAGQSGSPGSADGNTASARFNAPIGVAHDLSGSLLVTDQSDHTVRLIAGGMVQTLAGRAGIVGFADAQGTAATFNAPTGIVVRRDNYSYTTWPGGSNAYGTIFVSDQGSHTIRTISSTGQVSTYVGLASTAGFSNGSRTLARFRNPSGLVFDGDGSLYVADTGNHVIRKVDSSGFVSTFAGTPGVGGLMDGPSALAQFLSPEGVAIDNARNIYVADTGNGVIRKITSAGIVSTLLVLGNVPTITTQPTNLTLTAGSGATFSVTATGEGTLTYQWKKDGAAIAGATSASYSIPSVSSGNAGNYTVAVSNSWGATESSIATLAVTAAPPPPSGGGSGGSSGGGGGGGGGGGAPSLPFLALLGIGAATRLVRRSAAGTAR